MKNIKFALRAAGILTAIIGLLWVGQGTGHFPYPAGSFMINQIAWAYRGAILAVLGLISVAISRRI
jgi:hypothetical protein